METKCHGHHCQQTRVEQNLAPLGAAREKQSDQYDDAGGGGQSRWKCDHEIPRSQHHEDAGSRHSNRLGVD